jgi:hypothetical protein
MADAESPQTVFEMLYTRPTTPHLRLMYDNGATRITISSAEPEFFKDTQFFIDEFPLFGAQALLAGVRYECAPSH